MMIIIPGRVPDSLHRLDFKGSPAMAQNWRSGQKLLNLSGLIDTR